MEPKKHLEAAADSLAQKLAELDLGDDERRVLAVTLGTGRSGDEVSGFAYDLNPNDLSLQTIGASLRRDVSVYIHGTADDNWAGGGFMAGTSDDEP